MRRRLVVHGAAIGASLLLALGLTSAASAGTTGRFHARQADLADPVQSQAVVRQQQADLADDLDVLRATSDEVTASIDALGANVAGQQQLTARATAAADEARRVEAAARADVDRKQQDVDAIAAVLRDLALSLYTRPPLDDTVHALVNVAPNDAPAALALARFRVEDVSDVLRANRMALDALAAAEAVAAKARTEAERSERAEKTKLSDLEAARSQQLRFAGEVSGRIERAMAEAAALSGRDAELSAEIQARELVLAGRLRDSLVGGAPPAAVDTRTGGTPAPAPGGGVPTTVTATTVPPPNGTAPPTTAPPAPPPPTTVAPPTTTTTVVIPPIAITPVDTSWVAGVEVASSIAGQFGSMVAAAAAEGISLEGYGYRNILEQIAIRREVCGPTDYDIYVKPSWECSPPVAIPGRSMHEKGLAIDFTEGGFLIRDRSHPVIVWLSAHAAAFGFYNLPSEPWHWSTTGG